MESHMKLRQETTTLYCDEYDLRRNALRPGVGHGRKDNLQADLEWYLVAPGTTAIPVHSVVTDHGVFILDSGGVWSTSCEIYCRTGS